MDSKEFKIVFGNIAKMYDFKRAFSGWYKESEECIAILELQKSSFADSYYLNVKIFIQGAFERIYFPNKDLIKSSMGHITNQIRDKDILDFTEPMGDNIRIDGLKELFQKHIVPFTDKALSKSGIKEMEAKGEIYLLPAVKEELFK